MKTTAFCYIFAKIDPDRPHYTGLDRCRL